MIERKLLEEGNELSARQQEILRLAADGLTDKEIAKRLSIALETVRTHWKRLRDRFDTSSRTQIVAIGLQADAMMKSGLVSEGLELLLLETAERKRAEIELEAINEQLRKSLDERNRLLAELRYKRSTKLEQLTSGISALTDLQTATENGPTVVSLGTMDETWQKVYMSNTYELLTGRTVADMLSGKVTPIDFVYTDDLGRIVTELERGIREGGNHFTIEYRGIRKDSSLFWCREWIHVERGADGTPTHYTGVMIPLDLLGNIEDSRKAYAAMQGLKEDY